MAGTPEHRPSRAVAVTSGGPDASLTYLAWVGQGDDAGVVVIDLGWSGADDALRGGLARLGAAPADVRAVFLTHSHRDHIAAWPLVAHAPFYLGAAEVDLLFGRTAHGGWIPRWADRLWRPNLPGADQIRATGFSQDTTFVFGSDTVHAFTMPGHTPGSSAYLLHGVLFVGDGMSHTSRGRLRHARSGYSSDGKLARASVCRLRSLIGPDATHRAPRVVCTAHARCQSVDSALASGFCRSTSGADP